MPICSWIGKELQLSKGNRNMSKDLVQQGDTIEFLEDLDVASTPRKLRIFEHILYDGTNRFAHRKCSDHETGEREDREGKESPPQPAFRSHRRC